jgi:hypothetical protein
MTPGKKRMYMFLFFMVFIIVIPVLILYSSGYRLSGKFKLVKTGGIYLVNDESDVVVKLNGRVKKRAGLFDKNLLIKDLKPATYYTRVEKDGYRIWEKNITVEEQKVVECFPLLIPVDLKPVFIPKNLEIKPDKKGAKTKLKPNNEYIDALDIFKTSGKPAAVMILGWESSDIKMLKLGSDRKLRRKVFIFREANRIYVKWTGKDDQRPYFISSAGKRLAFAPDKGIISFDFFPGRDDSMLVLLEDGTLCAVEIDTRFDIQNNYRISRNCQRFATMDELLYYFSGGGLFRINFEP